MSDQEEEKNQYKLLEGKETESGVKGRVLIQERDCQSITILIMMIIRILWNASNKEEMVFPKKRKKDLRIGKGS
jgi:hypothetical protein